MTIERFHVEYQPEPNWMDMKKDHDPSDWEDTTISVEYFRTPCHQVLERVREQIYQRQNEGHRVNAVVLGVWEYKRLHALTNHPNAPGPTVEGILGYNVVVVPGSCIHVPLEPEKGLIEHIEEVHG